MLFFSESLGLGYDFGFVAFLHDPTAQTFALIMASISYISARIAFVLAVLTHFVSSGSRSRAISPVISGLRKKAPSALHGRERPMSSRL